MAQKHLVVQGATCLCKFGNAPDLLKVLTHKKEYANDKDGARKLIASEKDIGMTFEKNCFGNCARQLGKPCQAVVTVWSGMYEKTILTHGGKVLLEDSKATCPIGGTDCIEILNHGQTAELSGQNFQRADPQTVKALNPGVDLNAMNAPQFTDGANEDCIL